MTTFNAEISIQWADNEPVRRYKVQRTREDYDKEEWERLRWVTPNSSGGAATPSVEWAFISSKVTIVLKPLTDANAFRICRIPSFSRAVIHPARFGFPPRLAIDFREELENSFLELSRSEIAAGRPAPDRNFVAYGLLRELWLKHRTPDEEKRWLDKLDGLGGKLATGHYYQGGIHWRDLNKIQFRADFYATDSQAPVSVFCASCEQRLTSVADAQALPRADRLQRPSMGATSEKQATATSQVKVFNDDYTCATIPTGRKFETIALEPEQTRLVKRIADEPGHCIARKKLVEERVAGTQPEKYFRRGALKELWDAGIIWSSKTGRLTMFSLKLFHE